MSYRQQVTRQAVKATFEKNAAFVRKATVSYPGDVTLYAQLHNTTSLSGSEVPARSVLIAKQNTAVLLSAADETYNSVGVTLAISTTEATYTATTELADFSVETTADIPVTVGPRRASVDADTVSLYSFDGVLTDAGPAAATQVLTGTASYVPAPTGGLAFASLVGDLAAANDVLHEITGAWTLGMWLRTSAFEVGAVTFLCMGGGTDDEANNILFGLQQGILGELAILTENGAGTDSNLAADFKMSLHDWFYLTVTKDATTAINVYVNGDLVKTGAVTAPTGGTTSVFQVGREEDGTVVPGTAFADVQLWDVEKDAAFIADYYRSLKG